ncbi:hypothetical protein [Nocardia nepalensis]|uniref:hypothetical protein n=1 Tax=Nocardia nepalensis TaxID=3375448 RepID=UPI003B674332
MSKKLTDAATSMGQIIVPLQWVSTSTPIAAKVTSSGSGVYQVATFVNVTTKNSQSPNPLQSTATYDITIDSNNNWLITNIGGIAGVTAPK